LVTLLVETPLDARQLTWLLALSCCVRGWHPVPYKLQLVRGTNWGCRVNRSLQQRLTGLVSGS